MTKTSPRLQHGSASTVRTLGDRPLLPCLSVYINPEGNFNSKNAHFDRVEGKTRKRQQTTVVQIDQCICVLKVQFSRFQEVCKSSSKLTLSLCFHRHVCRRERLCSPSEHEAESSASALLVDSVDRPTANTFPPFISPNLQRGRSIPVQPDTQISRDSDRLMLEDWQTSTDQSFIQKPRQRYRFGGKLEKCHIRC